ncbi:MULTISPECIES: hypothetical protein [Ralstonia solanacearum species complex]|uniref:TIR domain-containing protein n=1 Tax=Ralstonia solanacearum IPO1609 TaxID=564066 RepID=A0ABF7RAL3_RALSL|nr:hypothetical protein [Ralstonia solanacearum]CEJ17855.1 hypothetical protein RSIPO_00030 [Ralstonia solanacearum IPO1609]ATI26062.1 hypothetical protein CCY86_00355 [Ralstonia solanacearum]ATJ84852.1 hypothetical protein CDC59_00355 [Ralstonia solanacearum]KEI31114.1 hypothetical protein CQ06_01225 [Ralstonia solanacearum]KFX78188.1 hypothetical protein KR98_15065 [Ralstonia solanacearum]
MWVTQSYLAAVEPDAKVFIYYLFEDYNPEQIAFTEAVQQRLEQLGEIYGGDVSLLMPNSRYAARIEAEVRGIGDFWWTLQRKLPALLISTCPLSKFSPSTAEFSLISFASTDPAGAAEAVERVRRIADQQLRWSFESKPEKEKVSIWRHFFDALELKPGIHGVRLDLKKLGAPRRSVD